MSFAMSKKCLPLGKRLSTLRVSTARTALVGLPRQVVHNGSGCPPQWAEVSRCTYRVIRLRSWARVLSYPVRGAGLLSAGYPLSGRPASQGVHIIPSRLKACEVSITGAIDSDCAGAGSLMRGIRCTGLCRFTRVLYGIGRSLQVIRSQSGGEYRQRIIDLARVQKYSLPCASQKRGPAHS